MGTSVGYGVGPGPGELSVIVKVSVNFPFETGTNFTANLLRETVLKLTPIVPLILLPSQVLKYFVSGSFALLLKIDFPPVRLMTITEPAPLFKLAVEWTTHLKL